MTPEIQAFAAGFPTTLAHAGLSLLLLVLAAAIATSTTAFATVPVLRKSRGRNDRRRRQKRHDKRGTHLSPSGSRARSRPDRWTVCARFAMTCF